MKKLQILQNQGSKIALAAGFLVGLAVSANAQLLHQYDFSTGTGNDLVGTANGTVQGGATIGGGALNVNGGNGGVDGIWSGTGPRLTLNSSAVSGITGAFTIEDWFTCTTGWPKFDTLYAFSDGSNNNYLLGAPVRAEDGYPSGVGFVGAGGLTRSQISTWDMVLHGIYLDTPGVHQTVLTYDGTTFSYYVDGVLANYNGYAATLTDPGFNLSSLLDIGIGGGSPYDDPSMTGSTYAFRIYGQALTSDQVAALDTAGAGASTSTINADIAPVPEPGSLALMGFGRFGAFVPPPFSGQVI